MNKEEQQAFDKCMKAIKRLLIEEKQCKQNLEKKINELIDEVNKLI